MVDPYKRALDQIHHVAEHEWRDRHGEGTVRNVLLGLRHRGLLDREAVLADMRARGHGAQALRRLDGFIDKTFRAPRYPR